MITIIIIITATIIIIINKNALISVLPISATDSRRANISPGAY